MKVQTLYIFAGLVWGLVLGPHLGLAAARTMGNVSWLYEFRNGAWASWAVILFGAIVGLMVLFFSYQFGAAAGRHYDNMSGKRLRHVKAVPWALIAAGIAVGTMTAKKVGDEQLALIHYVQEKKNAVNRLQVLGDDIHRITAIDLAVEDDPQSGQIHLVLRGRREGDYRIEWRILSKVVKKTVFSGSQVIRLGPESEKTAIPISRRDIALGYINLRQDPEADISVDEDVSLILQLRPILRPDELSLLPEIEARKLREGEKTLFTQAGSEFRLKFTLRQGRIAW